MSRINDKTVQPVPGPQADRRRNRETEPPPLAPLPPGARIVSSQMSADQRMENQRLVALYHALRESESRKMAREAQLRQPQSNIKGWAKRQPTEQKAPPGQPPKQASSPGAPGKTDDADEGL